MKQIIKHLVMGMTSWAWKDEVMILSNLFQQHQQRLENQHKLVRDLYSAAHQMKSSEVVRLANSVLILTEALEECLPYVQEEYEASLDLKDAEGDACADKISKTIEKARAALAKTKGEAP